jgi:hypothetical protein
MPSSCSTATIRARRWPGCAPTCAKGGDYAGARLPEADLLRGWGGRLVLLPYLPNRSTTRILAHAAVRPRPAEGLQQREAT